MTAVLDKEEDYESIVEKYNSETQQKRIEMSVEEIVNFLNHIYY
ncbi:MAG: hypothetical protein SPL73_07920 [Cyanobacteriota bacterium]|nr:hypothetical protein [Cyanobacteriota bacterium]MDY6359500.1 hypothetical protein [Cyanobacteriota bacterium]MDY6364798.1 hypothetical protein [Cyanobacteriota bacterium]MDY6383802.1 hypothetical protein [Cyanobacteriota bacterium]